MRAKKSWSIAASLSLIGGLLVGAAPGVVANPLIETRSKAQISGTPSELLATVPAVAPLAVGYKPGMFLPANALTKRNKRGCTLRNELLIKMAVKKPKVVGRQCALQGGEWLVDFGTKRLRKASQVKLGKLMPDKYVYAQGAFSWTPAQRNAFATTIVQPTRSTRSLPQSIQGWLNQWQPLSPSVSQWLAENNSTLDKISVLGGSSAVPAEVLGGVAGSEPSGPEAELEALKRKNPALFTSWTIAMLMNAKSWGISFSPIVKANFQVTINECAADATKGSVCSQKLSFPGEASRFGITVVPDLASTVPKLTASDRPTGYGSPTSPVIDRHLFGIHAPANWFSDIPSGAEGPTYPETIPNVPVGYLRLWDTETTWRDIEPTKGAFDWRKLERQIQTGQVLDAKVMYVLGGTPGWAADGSVTSAPKNVADWRAYVKAVACRFPNSIHAYEIWNEANLQTFWTGSATQMADLTLAAFEEIRACSPNALVVAASTTTRASGSFATFFPAYLEELKKRNWPADAYSVHSYPAASGNSEARIQGVGQFRTMLALAGAPFTTVFDTEVNYGLAGLGEGKRNIEGVDAMTLISRTYIDSARYGFGSTFWYVWTAQPDGKFGIQFTPNATAEQRAWRTTYDWLVGAQYQRCFTTARGVTVCQFNKGSDNFSIVWRGDVGSATGDLPAAEFTGLGSRQCDLGGNCFAFTNSGSFSIGPMPVRIDGPPLEAGSTAPGPSSSPDSLILTGPQFAPVIVSVDLIYGVANKADATASWTPPLASQTFTVSEYIYDWRFCSGRGCRRVGSGITSAGATSTSIDLSEGPGTYEFTLVARGTSPEFGTSGLRSPAATQRFTLLSSKAAPPSNVLVDVGGAEGQVAWSKPSIRAGLVEGYEVEVRNVTKDGKWKKLPLTKRDQANFKAADISLFVGNVVQARVRTVLANGQKSVFVASNELTVSEQVTPAEVSYAGWLDGAVIMRGFPGGGVREVSFPQEAYQVRYSLDGTNWTSINYQLLGPSGPAPDGNRTLIPYLTLTVFPLGTDAMDSATTRFQIRGVDNSGRPPSDWVDFKVTRYS